MNRRAFLVATFALAGSSTWPSRSLLAQLSDPETSAVPSLPTATYAMAQVALQGDSSKLLEQPLAMAFWTFGFASIGDAEAEFDYVADFYFANATEAAAAATSKPREVSVGPLGDDRRALLTASIGDLGAHQFVVAVRVESSILVLQVISASDNTTTFVAEFLASVIDEYDGTPDSLIPDMALLPIGWSYPGDRPRIDMLEEVRQGDPKATPEATPHLLN